MKVKVLLDTNIIIHREANRLIKKDIGRLFRWLDHLNYTKCIHPTTVEEIEKHKDEKVVETMNIKMGNYHLMKTQADLTSDVQAISNQMDVNNNDLNDTKILNELACDRVNFLVTEDKKIHEKASKLGIDDKVFTIDAFLEKVYAENPDLVSYKVLSVRKKYFGNIDINDPFFESFKNDYQGFEKWFNKKSDEIAYICENQDTKEVEAFLYLKVEGKDENYVDIVPQFSKKKRLKIGTFKVVMNGFKLGERFLKIIFDNALINKVDEIYVTIFQKRLEQQRLINLLREWGFIKHGEKTTSSGTETVFIRDFSKEANLLNPTHTYPYISTKANIFLVPIYPDYHTELLPDSILNTEKKEDFIDNEPHRNAIRKVYLSRSIERNLHPGDIIVFYRTKSANQNAYYSSVVSTIGLVENVITDIKDGQHLISLCRKRSVFSDAELLKHWNYKKNSKPFIVNFLYIYSFEKRLNLENLIKLGIIKDINSAPRGFTKMPLAHFEAIIKESKSNESFIIN